VRPNKAVGDSKYGTASNILAVEDAGIRASFPLADTDHRKSPYYPPAPFAYDAERDEYRCPRGQPLRRDQVASEKGLVGYVAEPAVCNACPVKAAGRPGTTDRHVHRSLHEASLDRVRGYHATASYEAMRKRAHRGPQRIVFHNGGDVPWVLHGEEVIPEYIGGTTYYQGEEYKRT
jgi:hypothetical protein